MRAFFTAAAVVAALALLAASPALAYDRTEANGCAGCHRYPGSVVMPFTAGTWLESSHANSYAERLGNTYCAKCHSPFEADPDATRDDNAIVPFEIWQAVTCGSCHPPHGLRVKWETPIGNYVVGEPRKNSDGSDNEDAWIPVFEEEANDLCEHCHEGGRHAKDFQGWGRVMFEKKLVRCMDCHMAKVPNPDKDDPGRMTRTHDMSVFDNLPWSCGAVEGGCHSNHDGEWAEKQILKDKLHGK